jgi:micrococcal nuclease
MKLRPLDRILLVTLLTLFGFFTQRDVIAPQVGTISQVTATPTAEMRRNGFVHVQRAVDGDTLELDDGTRVRMVGIDTPESVHPNKPVQCFGKEASHYTASLVNDQWVRMERDITDKDRYGRLLRIIYMEDGTMLNDTLVRQGYAHVYTYPPDITYIPQFRLAEQEARATGRGLWSGCPSSQTK